MAHDRHRFLDRLAAGRALGELLARQRTGLAGAPLVLGLARGGVPVAGAVAEVLGAELDVLVCRKIGAPQQPEFGIGAVSAGGGFVHDEHAARSVGVEAAEMEQLRAQEQAEAERRVTRYRGGAEPVSARVPGRAVVLVDDGLATGVTALAGLRALREHRPASLTMAAPVSSSAGDRRIATECDARAFLLVPEPFGAVASWYQEFEQLTDEQVQEELDARNFSGHDRLRPQ